jgi:T-complex protein 1 subunit beta
LIEEVMIGEDKLIHFSGVALGEACTIVLRGASTHILEEADRCGPTGATGGPRVRDSV